MKISAIKEGLFSELRTLRQDIHANPEFGFKEDRTARQVAALLRASGLSVTSGVGGTGVVGTLQRGSSRSAIILRADMDALQIHEAPESERLHASRNAGLMHACGHDGHTAMLVGAAQVLAEQGGFEGSVHFVFQPAEEWGKGMLAMLDDGLLERFPATEAYALHNMPGIPIGKFETCAGVFRSAEDNFRITIKGKSAHSSRPHWGRDALVATAALVTALQTIVSRVIQPSEQAVVTCTDLKVEGVRNVSCGEATLSGDCRSLSAEVSALIEYEMRRLADNVAQAHGCTAVTEYTREFVATVNDPLLTREVAAAADIEFGPDAVNMNARPSPGSEDFGQLLQRIPGCNLNMGNGSSAALHNPAYDFDDDAIPYGVRLLVAIARRRLPIAALAVAP